MRRALLPLRSYVAGELLRTPARVARVASSQPALLLQQSSHPASSAAASSCFAALRAFASAAPGRVSGTMKMWNDEKGFGFITPAEGTEDVFVHRSALGEGVTIESGSNVTYEAVWDDRRNKYRAASIELGGDGAGKEASFQPRGNAGGASKSMEPSWTLEKESPLHMVGGFTDWSPSAERMAEGGDGLPQHQVKIRSDAPKVGGGSERREEFQIVVDKDWAKRMYPAGGMNEEVVTLIPGKPSALAYEKGRGHGRNWAVEGTPGTTFQVICDPEGKTVSCELVSKFAERS